MAVASSLFDAPPEPVLPSATFWLTETLFGQVAVSLCVIAVAFLGLMLLSGRLAARDGVRVVICCFVLLGAPVIAAGLRSAADLAAPAGQPEVLTIEAEPPPSLPPANYDPYAGASLRQ